MCLTSNGPALTRDAAHFRARFSRSAACCCCVVLVLVAFSIFWCFCAAGAANALLLWSETAHLLPPSGAISADGLEQWCGVTSTSVLSNNPRPFSFVKVLSSPTPPSSVGKGAQPKMQGRSPFDGHAGKINCTSIERAPCRRRESRPREKCVSLPRLRDTPSWQLQATTTKATSTATQPSAAPCEPILNQPWGCLGNLRIQLWYALCWMFMLYIPRTCAQLEPTASPILSANTSTPTSQPSTAHPTLSIAPSRMPSGSPTPAPTISHRPSTSPTVSPSQTPSQSVEPTNIPTNSPAPTSSPSSQPSQAPSFELRSLRSRRFMILEGLTTPLIAEDGNQTIYAGRWENWTTAFVREFWSFYFQSPFLVESVGTTMASAERLEPEPKLRLRQLENNGNDTEETIAPSPGDDGNDDDDGTVLPVRIIYRQQIDFRLLDENAAMEIFGTNWREALFLEPFVESPFVYTNQLAIVTESDTAITLVSTGPDFSNLPPTSAPSSFPSLSPSSELTAPPSPVSEPTQPDDDNSDGRIIGFVVAVVVISVFVAAGYLYYLVRKEDRHPVVGELPDNLTGQNYFLDRNGEEGLLPRPTSSDSPLQPPSVAEEHQSFPPRSMAPDDMMVNNFQDGTTQTIATTSSGDGNNRIPPSMAVLDDVLPSADHHDRLAEFGTTSSEEFVEAAGRPASEIDPIRLNPSFDSADTSAASTNYDMTGFQMNVQNLDDL